MRIKRTSKKKEQCDKCLSKLCEEEEKYNVNFDLKLMRLYCKIMPENCTWRSNTFFKLKNKLYFIGSS